MPIFSSTIILIMDNTQNRTDTLCASQSTISVSTIHDKSSR